MGSSNQQSQSSTNQGANSALTRYNALSGTNNPLADQLSQFGSQLMANYTNATNRSTADYSNIMGNYNNLYGSMSGTPSPIFNWNPVSYSPGPELGTAYGDLNSAGKGFQNFADTGGFSSSDIANMRARGTSPITAAYGNTISALDRANTLGGGSANYIAARAQAQRQLPQQLADAQQGVESTLAQMIQSGKLAGLQGLLGVGGTEGGLSEAEANAQMQAAIANSTGTLGAAEATNNASLARNSQLMQSLSGMNSLYGTTPGMANMFGNQVMNNMGQQISMYGAQNNNLNDLLRIASGNQQQQGQSGPAWWQYLLNYGGKGIQYASDAYGGGGSSLGGSPFDSAGSLSGVDESGMGLGDASGITGGDIASGAGSSGADAGLTGLGGYTAGIGLPLAIMAGVNKYTGGPSPYSTGSNYNPFGTPSGVTDPYTEEQNRMRLQQYIAQNGPDAPIPTGY